MTPTRVVLDTNCLVSALIFSHGRAGQLRIAWQRGDIIPVVCRESVAELLRVLGYPKFKLRHEDIKNLLADVLPWAETLELNSCDDNIEFLRDRDDAVFIRLARAADTAYLVSGDRHLLELRGVDVQLKAAFGGGLQNCLSRPLADVGMIVQRPGNGADGIAGLGGQVFDGHGVRLLSLFEILEMPTGCLRGRWV